MQTIRTVTTVTLNAAIDKTYFLDQFALGQVTRVRQALSFPGGKGINVARVARILGCDVTASGFVAGHNGSYIEQELSRQGIRHDFVRIAGESRLCLNIIDRSNGVSTEILEPGPQVAEADIAALTNKLRALAARSGIVVFSGSAPQGTPPDIYATLAETVRAEGAKVFLDTSGSALVQGLRAKPFFVKPNEQETEAILGKKPERDADLHAVVRKLMNDGIRCVAVSLGERGSVVGADGELYAVQAPAIEPVNTVGCGDSFVAGMACAVVNGAGWEECLRMATAAGTANALTDQAGWIRIEDYERLLEKVEIRKIV